VSDTFNELVDAVDVLELIENRRPDDHVAIYDKSCEVEERILAALRAIPADEDKRSLRLLHGRLLHVHYRHAVPAHLEKKLKVAT
jgi:hypothetical protein